MDAKLLGGKLLGLPVGGALVNIASADATALIAAATGLAKTAFISAGVATAVVGVGVAGVGIAILTAIAQAIEQANETTVALGSSPNWIKIGDRSFWGIILDDDLEFVCDGQLLKVRFDFVSELNVKLGWGSGPLRMKVKLVNGDQYECVENKSPLQMRVATLGGVQTIPLMPERRWFDHACYPYPQILFQPSRVRDIVALRNQLQWVLDNNGVTITQLLGPNVIQQFFNVPAIP